MTTEDLVSIITPAWNSEKYIFETIKSVQNQTYKNWEILVIDDCSTDRTADIVNELSNSDHRIKYIRQKINLGAGHARNTALQKARGKYIAYLDSDDIWKSQKLSKQISFMKENKCAFSCTSYEVIDDSGKSLKKIYMMKQVDYYTFLTNNLLQTVGIVIDISKVDKKLLLMPEIRRRQDAATWLQILKAGHICYGMPDVLAEYRRTPKSLSSNKIKAVWGTWCLYRKIEKLPFLFSIYCFVRYAFLAVWKRVYFTLKQR